MRDSILYYNNNEIEVNLKDGNFQNSNKDNKMLRNSFAVLWLVAQSCLTLCDPTDCSLPSPSVHGNSPGKTTGVGYYAPLQGIFPTQGWTPGLLHYRRIVYQVSHKGSPLKEINPEYSLEGLMLKLKLQYFGHLMRKVESLERTLMLGD